MKCALRGPGSSLEKRGSHQHSRNQTSASPSLAELCKMLGLGNTIFDVHSATPLSDAITSSYCTTGGFLPISDPHNSILFSWQRGHVSG
jgi:hypothetical protein